MGKGSGTCMCKKQGVEVSYEISILINVVSEFLQQNKRLLLINDFHKVLEPF